MLGNPFEVVSPFTPTGDQPGAIDALSTRISGGERASVLLGATGTGKTFTMANVIQQVKKPTLIISHNKTLAAQLFEEMRELFPNNSVNYFVSYYDYYQPEAYIPQRDIYIEKDASRNADLEALRLAATSNLLSRRDVIVVASVSCIFGLGSPAAYGDKVLTITRGAEIERRKFLLSLNEMQYQRNEIDFGRGKYRVRGDAIEIWPAYEKFAVRMELFGDEIERLELINPTSGEILADERQFFLFPAVHYVMPEDQLQKAITDIKAELDTQVLQLRSEGKLLEAQRLLARTKYDVEMIEEVGYCSGVENYSRFFDGREPGERPFTLLDYFRYSPREDADTENETPGTFTPSEDWLCIIDESHVTLPQIKAMYNGDKARKTVLVEHGFRLPSALDNRPLRFEEWESVVPQIMYVSATPSDYELEQSGGEVAEQVIRPTGLLDPVIDVKPARGQVADMLEQCRARVDAGERVLVIALTKRLCEDLARYIDEQGLRVRYLHSDIETLERVEILNDLRKGEFQVLVGVNLLREGLDLPEVSLVCILDADKEGFLRSPTSLIQQMGRAARNVNATVVMYADKVTEAMDIAISETERRRAKQVAYNEAHGITPQTVKKAIRAGLETELKARRTAREAVQETDESFEVGEMKLALEDEMLAAAQDLDFETAARLRDQLKSLDGKADSDRMTRSQAEKAGESSGNRKPGMPGVKASKRKKRSTGR